MRSRTWSRSVDEARGSKGSSAASASRGRPAAISASARVRSRGKVSRMPCDAMPSDASAWVAAAGARRLAGNS